MNYKYIILDFGKVLAGPTTGEWFITPKFKEIVDMNLVDINQLKQALKNNSDIISRKMITEEEEYQCFYEYYSNVLKEINYPLYNDVIPQQIAHNFTYESDKYTFYEGVKEELEILSKKYKLIMLTDNWPCITRILNEKKLTKYFDKIYISSNYGVIKSEGTFFDYLINDYDIKSYEALFIDDAEINLKVGKEKGLDVLQMDREHEIKESEYKLVDNLLEIIK